MFRSEFLKHNTIFLIGTLAISFFNYLYYPVISRLVSVHEFGEIQAAISLFMQLGIILTAFGYVVTVAKNNESIHMKASVLILHLERAALVLALVSLALLVIFGQYLQSSFQLTSIYSLLLIGVLVIINIPSTSRSYVLQASKRLKEVSLSGILFSISKLLLSVVFIILGFDVIGVLIAYIIAQCLTVIYLLIKTKKSFPGIIEAYTEVRATLSPKQRKILRKERRFGVVVICLLFLLTLLYTFDVVVARILVDTYQAGLYSGVSSVARIVFFITASVAGVLIATVKISDSPKDSLGVLRKSVYAVVAIGGSAALFFSIFPTFSLNILLGRGYDEAAYLLPVVSGAMLLCALNNLFVLYQIGRRQMESIYAVFVAVLLLVGYLLVNHASISDIAWGYFIANAILGILLVTQILVREKHVKE